MAQYEEVGYEEVQYEVAECVVAQYEVVEYAGQLSRDPRRDDLGWRFPLPL